MTSAAIRTLFLPRLTDRVGPLDRGSWIDRQDFARDHPIKQASEGREVQLDRTALMALGQRFDIGRHLGRTECCELNNSKLIEPSEKAQDGTVIGTLACWHS